MTTGIINSILGEQRYATHPNWFEYYFNSPVAAVDPDYWTAAGDAGGFIVDSAGTGPPSRKLYADTALNNDYYIHGDGKYAKLWNFQASNYSVITFEARIKMNHNPDTQALLGLFKAGSFPTGYAEPLVDCAQFFIDDAISPNFVCRSYDAAEQETASGLALDTSYHTFKFTWESAYVLFYIDDILYARHATQVPDSPLGIVVLIRTEKAGGAERSLDIEYIKVKAI